MDKLEQLTAPLLEWFRDNARPLPWRDDPTPYHVWLSEIMLQQTRVAAVLGYYARFLEEAPDISALAALPGERLMKLWQGLGYYSRARNLQRAAKVIVSDYGGTFPPDYTAIRSLPGVGDYTAGAVCSIALGLATPAVDGNVLRVYARICGDGGDISTPQMKKKVAHALERVIPVDAPGAFNQALMELGATVCLPNGAPLCEKCPARELCAALAQGPGGGAARQGAQETPPDGAAHRVAHFPRKPGGPAPPPQPGPAGRAVGIPQRAGGRPTAPVLGL